MNISIPLFIILLILLACGTSMSFANTNNQQATSADNDGATELPRHVRPPCQSVLEKLITLMSILGWEVTAVSMVVVAQKATVN